LVNLTDFSVIPRSADQDKINALDHGADDYLTKPFSTGELLARVRALLRRSQFKGQAEQTIIRFGEFEINIKDRRMTRGSQLIHLTPIEFQLLRVLVLNAGRVLTHRQLLSEVWGNAYIESNHYLRVYIGHLRQKLELDPSQPQHLLTETGIGYRFQL
jgi:two-component system KDP operon response regulator KdpE